MGGCVALNFSCDQAVNQICSCLFGNRNYIYMMKANLGALETARQKLQERREDLLLRVSIEEDRGLERLPQVEGWLSRVASIDSQVSDLLKVKPTEIKRLCIFGYISKKCISSCKYGKDVWKKLEEVKELLSEGVFKELARKRPVPKVVKKDIQTTIGLDSMVGKAWDSIMKPERRTLGIYGMGGVGKTTLLAHINKKFDKEVNEFDVVIWVVVSKDLQYKGIQDQILGRLRVDKEWEKETEKEKVSSIANILGRKKFVLLLDDLWSEVDLNKIGVPRPSQENGSKIVFTTRSKEVCRYMEADDDLKINCLPRNEAWQLFQNVVGEVALKRHQDIPTLAKRISEKCYGLPLALNVIGKAMSYREDVHEWRHAVDVLNKSSHEKFPGMEEKILSILKFSYDGLEDDKVKSCFLYCSLFPEDYEIKKDELIEYWINEGFINGKRDEDGSNNQGHVIIGSLVRAHLLMEFEKEFTPAVKMHDVLREMALWVGSTFGKEEEKQFVKTGVKLSLIPKDINWSVLRRISLMSNRIEQTSYCPECPHLSTLLLGDNKLEGISGNFFQFMPVLVVLDLSRNRDLSELPEEICSLTSLQYLNLSYTSISSLSVGLKRLRKLISLDLEFTWLTNIDGIGTSLPNLQVLKLYHSSVQIDASSIEELQLLEHLKVLTGNVIDALMLESIQRVERLASCIQCLWMINISTEVLTLNTVALGGLRELDIELSGISEIKIEWKSKEKDDLICNSTSPCFKHLSSIVLRSLEGPKELTWLFFAPNLKHLEVAYSGSLEEIINKEKGMHISNVHPDMMVPFQKLESFNLRGLDELKRICSTPPALPSLKNFVVEHCRNLPKAATASFPDMNRNETISSEISSFSRFQFSEELKMEGNVLTPCLEGMKHVKSEQGEMLTMPFLDLCKNLLPAIGKFGFALTIVKADISGNISRLEKNYLSDPDKYKCLYTVVQGEVESETAKGSSSCTNALLWLTRAMDFLVEVFRNLLAHPDWSMSQACSDSYQKTLRKWHGWLSSSTSSVPTLLALLSLFEPHFLQTLSHFSFLINGKPFPFYQMGLKLAPDRKKFMEVTAGSGDMNADMQRFCSEFGLFLQENHKFLASVGMDDMKAS